jgi:hypothetical protein
MKSFLLIAFFSVSMAGYAQKYEPRVVLNKGQKIVVKTSSNQEADMGMGMEMKNTSSSEHVLNVLDANKENYILTSTLTGLKLSMDFMGQSNSYDSDKKEDADSEMGKSVKNLNIPDTFEVNKNTAAITYNKKPAPEASADVTNPMESMFESMGSSDKNIGDEFFLIIPAGIKIGDKWFDSSSTPTLKSVKEYTLQSIDNGIASIKSDSQVDNNSQVELQGMQVTIVMSTKSSGIITADTKTSLVSKRTNNATINGNLEVMGQTMTVTGKSAITTVFEY